MTVKYCTFEYNMKLLEHIYIFILWPHTTPHTCRLAMPMCVLLWACVSVCKLKLTLFAKCDWRANVYAVSSTVARAASHRTAYATNNDLYWFFCTQHSHTHPIFNSSQSTLFFFFFFFATIPINISAKLYNEAFVVSVLWRYILKLNVYTWYTWNNVPCTWVLSTFLCTNSVYQRIRFKQQNNIFESLLFWRILTTTLTLS